MPELPEVETIRSQVAAHLAGSKLAAIEVKRASIIKGEITSLKGKTIKVVRRYGKLMVVDFSKGLSLAIHLKMTGRLTLLKDEMELPIHTHVIFTFKQGDETKRVAFSDTRRFGFLHVLPTHEVGELKFIRSLGKEPFKDLDLAAFVEMVRGATRPIKNLLLDQSRIAGIGNIYACEALWLAGIKPTKRADKLTKKEVKLLFGAVESVLKEGIARGGASDNDYRNLLGEKGEYQNFFKVYGRTGKPCLHCETPLKRIVQAGRSTFYCPTCQS